MVKELIEAYENPDYPVAISFTEKKKSDTPKIDWFVRKSDVELIIVNNGEIRVSTDLGVMKASSGQGIMINCGVKRYILSSQKEDTAYFSVVFSPKFALGIEEKSSIAEKYYFPIVNNRRLDCILMDEDNLRDETALDKINDIIAVNMSKKYGYEILTKGYICALWGILLDYLNETSETFNGVNVPSQDELRVRSAIAYIMENYADPITLENIADKIHVSRNECCRCFKRVLSVSPVEYLIRIRIFEAAKLLYKDPLSVDTISELSFRTGFNNTSYFNRMFKRYFDCTPTEFTKILKNDPDRARRLYDSMQETVTGI